MQTVKEAESKIILGMAERIAQQSELLGKRAEKQPRYDHVCGWCGKRVDGENGQCGCHSTKGNDILDSSRFATYN